MPVVFSTGLAPSVRSARVIAIIPARYQSTRLPGKPLALIDGRPMIQHVHERATRAASVDAVVVATDDERVAEAVDRFGGTAVMTRPDHSSGTDRLAEVAATLESELIVNVQGDEPTLAPAAIDAAVGPLLTRTGDRISTLRARLSDREQLADPHVVKVTVDEGGYALYFSRAPIPFARDADSAAPAWKHLGLYVYRRETLRLLASLPASALERSEGLEQLRALEHGIRILTVESPTEAIGVDTPADLERVRRLLEAAPEPQSG